MVKSTQLDYPEPARLVTQAQMCADVCSDVWICICRPGSGGEADEFVEKEKVGGGEGNRSDRETSAGPCAPRMSPDAPRPAGPVSTRGDGEEPPQSPA